MNWFARYSNVILGLYYSFLTIVLAAHICSCVVVVNKDQMQANKYASYYSSYTMPAGVNTPMMVGTWMSLYLDYQEDLEGDWKAPWETIRDHGGDCEDFAILASLMLSKLGYKTEIIGIMFWENDKKSGHAICLFQYPDGTWSYFSNYLLVDGHFKDIEELLGTDYPTWYRVMYFNQVGGIMKDIKK